ncbi:unnamed protein product [Arctogadus glacialis]
MDPFLDDHSTRSGLAVPTGATIKRDEETGEIYIARVIHGGLADRSGVYKSLCRSLREETMTAAVMMESEREPGPSRIKHGAPAMVRRKAGAVSLLSEKVANSRGLLHTGDLLLEVNGNPVEGLEPEQVIQILIHSQGTILFKVIPNKPQTTATNSSVFMRAMVDYSPQQDWSLPCPDVGMSFRKGQLLEVVDQTDGHWWQARRLPTTSSCAGLIPSTSMLKSKQREQWWSQPLPIDTCIRQGVSRPVDEKADEEPLNNGRDRCVWAGRPSPPGV